MKKITLLAILVTLSGCLSADYHLAKITESYRTSKQIYHIEQYKIAAGIEEQEELELARQREPKSEFVMGLGSFTVGL